MDIGQIALSKMFGTLVSHPLHGVGVVYARERITDPGKEPCLSGRVAIHFEPHPLLADPAYFWPQELTLVETPWRWEKAEDIPLAWCWYRGTEHAGYGWAPRGATDMLLSEEQRAAYLRGHTYRRKLAAGPTNSP